MSPKSQGVSHVVVNPSTNIIYAVGENAKAVFVINGSTNTVSRIPLRDYPNSIAVDENTNTVYVTLSVDIINPNRDKNTDNILPLRSEGFVSVIDGNNNTVIKNIQVGTSPSAIVVNPNTS